MGSKIPKMSVDKDILLTSKFIAKVFSYDVKVHCQGSKQGLIRNSEKFGSHGDQKTYFPFKEKRLRKFKIFVIKYN